VRCCFGCCGWRSVLRAQRGLESPLWRSREPLQCNVMCCIELGRALRAASGEAARRPARSQHFSTAVCDLTSDLPPPPLINFWFGERL
jgi:hypothetical protein